METEATRSRMIRRIQKKLGLPLPSGADHAEGLRRFKAAIAYGTLALFANWVSAEKRRVATKKGAGA